MSSIRDRLMKIHQGYVRFVEGQGFFVILATCIAIIAGTAVWTGQTNLPSLSPTPPVDEALSAAQLQQETLSKAAAPIPSPIPSPAVFSPPLDSVKVLVPFDGARLRQSAVTGLWKLHDAVDLQCDTGDAVMAIAEGVVLLVQEDSAEGCCAEIDHGSGLVARYAGMAALSGIRAGDPVAAGQTVGFAGDSMLSETDGGVHLHLRVTREGKAIDPLLLWKK